MRYVYLLILLVVLIITEPVLAQQASRQTPGSPATTVALTIKTDLAPVGDNVLQLPTDLVKQFSAQDALANLEVSAAERARVSVNARFLFPSMEAFTTWQAREQTQKLMERLEGSDASLSYTVSVSRHPLRQPSEDDPDN